MNMEKPVDRVQKVKNIRRMTDARQRLIQEEPFYGSLLMHLSLGVTRCGTACTDMKHILIDPDFAERLSDEELTFILKHELMHCVLNHCVRAAGHDPMAYNIASDIVVNSNILLAEGVSNLSIDGCPVMHRTPMGSEGYLYSAEEVYAMLQVPDNSDMAGSQTNGSSKKSKRRDNNAPSGGKRNRSKGKNVSSQTNAKTGGRILDDHSHWKDAEKDEALSELWRRWTEEAVKAAGGPSGLPPIFRGYVPNASYVSQIDWRQELEDFLQEAALRDDYTFLPADRRYASWDIIVPSYAACPDQIPADIWYCVDTSASISNRMLQIILDEIRQAAEQNGNLRAYLSFFDTHITEPVPFSATTSPGQIKPVGGGGTSFHVIFQYLRDLADGSENVFDDADYNNPLTDNTLDADTDAEDPMENIAGEESMMKLPACIVILTDGYAPFPAEEEAMGVPVLWIIADEKNTKMVQPPWGKCIHIIS